MKKKIASLSLALVMAMGCIPGASACATNEVPPSNVSSQSVAVPFSLGNSVSCQNDRGDSDPFDIHMRGRVRFYFTNNGYEDIVITIHKKGLLNTWGSAVTVNGKSSFTVPAKKSVEFDTDGSTISKGTYRCEASNSNGTKFNYVCALRELDYTP